MPWQQQVADVAGEIDLETGYFAYREVIWTVMRQNGKTTIVFPIEVDRGIMWSQSQRVIYTAQTGGDARKKLLEDQVPLLEKSVLWELVTQVQRAQGNEGVLFTSGSRISLAASAQESAHGFTLDLGVVDECWADEDNRREQAMVPAMNTRPMAQLLVCSTMGTEASVYLNRKVEIGRHLASSGVHSGIAYFEWSIPEDEDIDDPEVWWTYTPALGHTIQESAIKHARQSMDEAEFRRAYCNQQTKMKNERIIPESIWEAVQDPVAEVARDREVVFGLDVHPDRASAAIAASDGQTVELIDYRPGTGWVRERVLGLRDRWGGRFVLDGGGPALSLAADLENDGATLEKLTSAEVAAACARMYDSLADMTIKVRTSEHLDEALSGLAKRPIGDRFVWSRQASSSDITPFVAATLALGGTVQKELAPLAAWT